ncbi:MAG: orotidine-5'-phosphate decarboxylase [Acidimicrobiia bacterium]
MSRILVALDVSSRDEAVTLAEPLLGEVAGFKVGLQLLMAEGPKIITEIASLGLPVFADAKLHDIPNTVFHAIRRLGEHGARWVTVHAAGGIDMMKAAVDGLDEGSSMTAGVLAVTVLTSIDEEDLARQGIEESTSRQVSRLAAMAARCGVEGVVCAAAEASSVKALNLDLAIVTPGIRPAGADSDDQARIATPAGAIGAGADLIVVGRPITRAADPVAAARAINREIEAALSAT